MTTLIQQLPPVRQFNQHFHYSITNWLPFYWKGFQQTTRYTYVIDDLSDLDLVFDDFSRAKKKNIRKARKTVDIKWDLSATEFYDNHRYTLKKSNAAIVYSRDIFNRLYEAGYARNQGRTIWAADGEGRIHAALFVVWDRMSAYDLISTIDPDLRNSGAASLLVWEMIKYIKEQQGLNRFDFEGSMIEGVENSFRQFGAAQYRYFHIYRDQRHGYEKLITRMLQYARCRLRFLKHGFKQTET
jgi:lipid II:glycine glycyltransferase (peptidoglycan interpeptide bridge formation enzyme)